MKIQSEFFTKVGGNRQCFAVIYDEAVLFLVGSSTIVQQEQLGKFKAWFDDYVAGFYGDDEYVNANLLLKEEHSRRTCEEMEYLAKELGLTQNQKRTAEAIALFHDIGRFEQFVKYRTYNDVRSVNHCLLGLEVLRQSNVFEVLQRPERELIERAIEYHGARELSKDLQGEWLLFARMIRDADKIDILYVVTEYYGQHKDNPERSALDLDLPDDPEYSIDVVEGVLRGRRIDRNELRTLNDMKLCQLAWVYDVNFAATLKRITQRRLLEKLVELLPKTPEIESVKAEVFGHVKGRLCLHN